MDVPQIDRRHDPAAVERILRGLPEWFGIEDALQDYVRDAAELPSYVAAVDDRVVGIALLDHHYQGASELYLIAVDRAHHGQGIGSALMAAMESDLRQRGARLWQVKTVAPSHPSPAYARTRPFYVKHGFEPLEEMHLQGWDGGAFLVSVKVLA